ncbi:MAG: glycerophosphodiester phosphodiesterase [Bacteroidetes bacterium 4572_77]|nr:MAG: glycerophosphodiester phosphodiesterase [Bacteroidetes bacterium 4572_77]
MNSKINLFLLGIVLSMLACKSEKPAKVYIPNDIVIAHRGSTYWTPEETEAAYRWARNIGADYLEVDIQRSKDGVLLALHDEDLCRTTNIEQHFPQRKTESANSFTYEELMELDAGSWFNKANPERKREGFTSDAHRILVNMPAVAFQKNGEKIIHPKHETSVYIGGQQYISTLEDIIRIAEGYCIARDFHGKRLYTKTKENGKIHYTFFYVKDPKDTQNRPGVYIETKEPNLFPGVENDLFIALDRLNWNILTKKETDNTRFKNAKVNLGNTSAKIILQTFSPSSLSHLYQNFKGQLPSCFLLWLGDKNMPKNDSLNYAFNIKIAQKLGAHIIGPSIAGAPNNYADLLTNENYQWIKQAGFQIHPYSFDTKNQTKKYGEYSNGMFTNRAELTINYYISQGKRPYNEQADAIKTLDNLGY